MNRPITIAITLVALSSGLLALQNSALQKRLQSVEGVILDFATGRPLEGVNITVLGTHNGDATDEAGVFLIDGLAVGPGEIELLVSAIGYENARLSIRIPAPEVQEIRLRETFFQMNELVVTGTRTAKLLVNTPIATEVITRQDILDSGARDVSELLEQRSGVVISPNVEGGMNASLLGIDGAYILVLIDGQPITGKFNGRIALDQISTTTIDKVEIVKGPSSAMYGSEAMGGVINIITSGKLSRPTISAHTRYTGSDEALNLFNRDLGKRDLRLNIDRTLGATRWQFDLDGVRASVDQSIKFIEIDNFANLSFRGGLTWEASQQHSLSARTNYFGTREQSRLATVTTVETNIARSSSLLAHDWTLSPEWSLSSVARQSSYKRDFMRLLTGEANLTEEEEGELEFNLVRQSEILTVNAGTEIGSATYRNDRLLGDERTLQTGGIYAQVDWSLSPALTIVAGSRIDANSEIDPVVSPRVALMLSRNERWKWRVAWGLGFKMPTFLDRYIDWNHAQYGYRIEGNPDLKPERSNGINGGVEYYHPGEYQVTASIYWNRFENMIDDVLISQGLFSYENLEQVDFRGVELQARWHLSPSWLASWGYSFVTSKNLASDQPIPNTRPHTASFRLSHKHSIRFDYALKAKVVGPYRPVYYEPDTQQFETAQEMLGASMTLDWDAHLTLSRWAKLGLGMRNMLDYTDEEFGPFVGRTFYLELESQLK